MLIVRGYFRRNREMWSATRWQTYNLMCVSMANIKRAGIYRPTDLIKFPWERVAEITISQEDIDELQAEMAAMNRANVSADNT